MILTLYSVHESFFKGEAMINCVYRHCERSFYEPNYTQSVKLRARKKQANIKLDDDQQK